MSRDLLSGLKTAEIALPVKNDVCPRCGSDNLEPSFISSSLSLHLRRCRNCGHVFASEEETHSASTSLPVDVGQTKAEHNLAQGVANITADEEDLNEIPPELDEFFTSHNFAFERDNNGVVTYRKVPPGNDKIEFDLNSGEWIHSGGGFKLGNELFPGDGNGLQELQKYLDSYSKFNRLEGLEASKIAAKPPVYKEDESIPDDYCIRCGQCRRQHGGSKPVSCIDRTDNHDWHPMSEIDPNAPVGVISVTGSPIPPMISSEKEAAGFRKAILPAALLMGLGPGALAQQPSTPKEKAPIVQQDPQNKSKITIESLDGAPISDISEGEPLIPKKTKPVLPVDDPYLRYRTQQASKEAGIGDTARATTAGELAEFFRKFDTTAPVIIESAAPTSPPIVMSIYEYWNSAGKPKITIDTDPFYTYVKNMDQEQLKRQERRKNMQIENAPKTSAAIPSYQQILNPAGFVVDENAPQESGMEIVYWNSRFKDGPSTDKGSIEAVVVLSDNSWEAYGGGGANDVIGEGLNPADLQEWLRSQGKVASVKNICS
jgi:transcription elongation factor Elf1